jgi:uncharacterized protein YndB with AHSA1/START domain
MATKTISKAIEIKAPAETVWHVLFDPATYPEWTSAFMPGGTAETDWRTGSQARFTGPDGNGVLAVVSESNPPRLLSMTYLGIISAGEPDTTSEEARLFKDCKEIYRLNEDDGVTRLEIAADMPEKYYTDMTDAWDQALQSVKRLAEHSR